MSFFFTESFILRLSCVVFLLSALTLTTLSQDGEKDPVNLFNKGQDAHEKGDFKTALTFYEEALKIAPEFPEAEYQRGSALKSLGKYAEAEKSFRRALELRENWGLPLVGLGEILVQNNKLAEADAILTKAISIEPENPALYPSLTELRLKDKSSAEVLKELRLQVQKAAARKPDASLFAASGAIERKLGDLFSAKSSLEKALKIDPNNSFALSESAEIAILENNFSQAQLIADKLIKNSPDFPSYKLLLARIYAAEGKADASLKILETLDARNADVVLLKNSLTVNETKDISALETQLASDPKNPAILGRLCNLTRTIPAKALDYCRRSSEAEPNNIDHAIGFGAALVQAKQFASAVTLLRRLLQIAPDNFTVHANLALALFESKNYAEAKTEYEWLIKSSPNLVVAYYFLAICHDNLQEYKEAMANYRKFLELADAKQNQLEIDKVNLRLPSLERQIRQGAGSKKGKKS